MFVWHTGEESGLWGSRYMADYPEVPLEKVAAQLNIDMIGRNRCDDASEEDTVYLVGSDRISTELHNVSEEANAELSTPMKLDYAMNDPADPESIYTRSDHYSYASKGIPIIFYTTGLHRDYHYVTDEVSKIDFPKLARVTQLAYQTAWKVGNLDHLPVRDNKGPRIGKGGGGKLAPPRYGTMEKGQGKTFLVNSRFSLSLFPFIDARVDLGRLRRDSRLCAYRRRSWRDSRPSWSPDPG
jgi:hypothetical protein